METFHSCSICGKWSDSPKEFDAKEHYWVKCECGKAMTPSYGIDPIKDLALSKKDKIVGILVK